jgi:hypothetical protein
MGNVRLLRFEQCAGAADGHILASERRRRAQLRREDRRHSALRGGKRLATAFTLVDNCLALGLDPCRYLVDVIDKLERGWCLRQLSELIPRNWARQQAAEHRPE